MNACLDELILLTSCVQLKGVYVFMVNWGAPVLFNCGLFRSRHLLYDVNVYPCGWLIALLLYSLVPDLGRLISSKYSFGVSYCHFYLAWGVMHLSCYRTMCVTLSLILTSFT